MHKKHTGQLMMTTMYFVLAAVLLSAMFQAHCAQGWTTLAYVHSSLRCPTGLEPVTAGGKQMCRKTVDSGCSSVIFPSYGRRYSRVCGSVLGFNRGTTDGFYRWACPRCTIDGPYVDGVSITHGQPRQHIWSFAAASKYRQFPYHEFYCPCTSSPNRYSYLPPFVGNDYSCEYERPDTYMTADQLWDAEGCVASLQQCCDRPYWFCKDLPQPTTDDIELRVCADQGRGDEDVYIEEIVLVAQ